MSIAKRNFLFLNIGHLLDHYFMLIFTTAVLTMRTEFADDYGRLLLLTTWSFFFFGGASLPAGWLGDKWSRHGMMIVFFIGIGVASIVTGLAHEAWHVEVGLALVGIFAAIYHPVGLALVVQEASRVGRALAINGVWGNMGVALAAVTTAILAVLYGWRMAFIVPGIVSIAVGVLYALHLSASSGAIEIVKKKAAALNVPLAMQKRAFIFLIVAPMFGGLIFNGTTVSLPKVVHERLPNDLVSFVADSASIFQAGALQDVFLAGLIAFIIFACAAVAQVIVGELLDRYQTKAIYVSLVAAQLTLCVGAIYAAEWVGIGIMLPLMLATFGIIPINDFIVAKFISVEYRSRVFAVKSFLGLSIGAVAIQMTGRLHEAQGNFNGFFWVLAGAAAVVLVSTLVLLPGKQATAPQPAE